jgi:hypothetical protein
MTGEPRLMRHYKGGLYVFLGPAQESTNGSAHSIFAVYYSLRDRVLRVRRMREFEERVTWPDGQERCRFITVNLEGGD